MHASDLGKQGEELVRQEYLRRGYNCLVQNFVYQKGNLGRVGEIDLICEKNGVLCVVEVKTRTPNSAIKPIFAMDYKKIKSIQKTYLYFITRYSQYRSMPCRIDYAEVVGETVTILENCTGF